MTEIIRKPRTDRFCQRCGRWNGTKTWDGQRQISFVLFNGFFVCDECEDDMMDLKDVDGYDYKDSCDCCVKGWSKANEFGRCVCLCSCGRLLRDCRYTCARWNCDDDEQVDVDDFEAPNIYPYKKCTKCEERKSCGSYDEDRKWLCEDCCAD